MTLLKLNQRIRLHMIVRNGMNEICKKQIEVNENDEKQVS